MNRIELCAENGLAGLRQVSAEQCLSESTRKKNWAKGHKRFCQSLRKQIVIM